VGSDEVRLLLDTHALLWWLAGEGAFTVEQIELLERAEEKGDTFTVASISLWEIAKLIELGRIELQCSPDVFFDDLEQHPRIMVAAISPRIALESTRLGSAFPRDPADQLIVATARVNGLRLVTADERIRKSGAVPVV
jgi:PIN domain nuclease of toxin-antitoxin system